MRAVGIKVLNSRLSEYLRLASQGETVLVTDRDRVVAEISPPRPGRGEEIADVFLAEAVRKGLVRPPLMRVGEATSSPDRTGTLDKVLSELDADRADR